MVMCVLTKQSLKPQYDWNEKLKIIRMLFVTKN